MKARVDRSAEVFRKTAAPGPVAPVALADGSKVRVLYEGETNLDAPAASGAVHLRDVDGGVTRISAEVGADAGLFGSNYRDGHPVPGPGSLVVGHVCRSSAGNRNRCSCLSCALQSGLKRFVQTPRAVDLLIKKTGLDDDVEQSE